MPQILNRPGVGPISFEKIWASNNGNVIGKLTGGGYAHTSGHSCTDIEELRALALPADDIKEAEEWFANAANRAKVVQKKIVITEDGFTWMDGSPITSYNEITEHIPAGPMQTAALDWFAEKRAAAKRSEAVAHTAVAEAAEQVAGGPPAPAPAPQAAAPKKKAAPKGRTRTPAKAPAPAPALTSEGATIRT
jgi:hypothetical protein